MALRGVAHAVEHALDALAEAGDAHPRSRRGGFPAPSSTSVCSSARRRSVMSSWVATQPPSPIGRLVMAMKRPSSSRTWLTVLPLAMLVSRSAIYWSRLPVKVPTLMRWSSRSRSETPGLRQLRRQIVHLDVALVAQDQPAGRRPHAQALRHVVERGQQAAVVPAKPRPTPDRAREEGHAGEAGEWPAIMTRKSDCSIGHDLVAGRAERQFGATRLLGG